MNLFIDLDFNKHKCWQEIATAFVKQYAFDIQIKVTTRDLEMTKLEENVDFTTFLTRWKEKVAKMENYPSEEDQV